MSQQHTNQRTPGPWKATGNGHKHTKDPDDDMMEWNANVTGYAPYTDNEYGDFEKHDSQSVASGHGRTFEEVKANAAFIAKACNNHDELLEALEDAYKAWDDPDHVPQPEEWQAAIAKAKGIK